MPKLFFLSAFLSCFVLNALVVLKQMCDYGKTIVSVVGVCFGVCFGVCLLVCVVGLCFGVCLLVCVVSVLHNKVYKKERFKLICLLNFLKGVLAELQLYYS